MARAKANVQILIFQKKKNYLLKDKTTTRSKSHNLCSQPTL